MLKRRFLLCVWCLGLGFPGLAQHIVWEKVFGFVSADQLGAITVLEDSTFLAIGQSPFLGGYVMYPGSEAAIGSIVMRLDKNGDTLYTRRLNVYCGETSENANVYVGHKYGDIYQAAITVEIPFGLNHISCPAVVEFNKQGQVFQTHILSDYTDWHLSGAIPTPDYGLILSGSFYGGLTLPTQMMSMKINFLGEVEWAKKWNPPAQVRGIGERIFQTKPNEYLVTGTLGRRIGGFTFDSLGNQLGTKVFYDTPSMYQFWHGEASITKDKSIVSAGYYKNGSNQNIGYFGLQDSLGNVLWGGEQANLMNYPQACEDGSIWVEFFNKQTQKVSLDKFSVDSVRLKQIPLYTAGINGSVYYQYLPIGNNQVIAIGFKDTPNFSYQFLITKIDSFGVPITAIEKQVSKPPKDYRQIVAFPNPTTQTVKFKNLDGQGHLRLYNLKGQMVKEEDIQPQGAISLHSLASGEYLWHISTADKKIYTGRILKE